MRRASLYSRSDTLSLQLRSPGVHAESGLQGGSPPIARLKAIALPLCCILRGNDGRRQQLQAAGNGGCQMGFSLMHWTAPQCNAAKP